MIRMKSVSPSFTLGVFYGYYKKPGRPFWATLASCVRAVLLQPLIIYIYTTDHDFPQGSFSMNLKLLTQSKKGYMSGPFCSALTVG